MQSYGKEASKRYMAMSEEDSYNDGFSAQYYDPAELAQGSYGECVDKYLGKIPIDGPDGYVFRKVTYEVNAQSATEVLGTFRKGPVHRGIVSMINGSTRTTVNINEDQQGGAGISSQNKLVDGDIPLGAILSVSDGREDDIRSGIITCGKVPVSATTVNASNVHYGVFTAGNDTNTIATTATGGSKSFAANSVRGVSVCDRSLDVYNSHHVHTIAADDIIAAPALSIAVEGITAADAVKIKYTLTVYCLMGPRPTGLIEPSTPDPSFKLSDITRKTAKHAVNALM